MTKPDKSSRQEPAADSPARLARELPARDYRGLRLASTDLIEALDNQRRAARHTRVGQGHLSRYVSDNPDCAETFMPIDVVADLEANASEPFVTRRLAEIAGYELVRVEAEHMPSSDEAALLAGARASTEALAEAWKALADGEKTPAERRLVHAKLREAVRALQWVDRLWQEQVP